MRRAAWLGRTLLLVIVVSIAALGTARRNALSQYGRVL